MKKLLLLLVVSCMAVSFTSAKKIRTDYRNALVFAYSQANSVYEDENIKLEIYNEKLWATNKTSKTLFIDLSQCFIIHNGSSRPLLSTGERDKKAKKGEKKASKIGISDKDDIYITIAPSMSSNQSETFIWYLATDIFGEYSTVESPSGDFSEYDKRLFSVLSDLLSKSPTADATKGEYVGTVTQHLTEDESINNIGASIAYSFNKNTENWNNIVLSTWVSDIIFAPFYVEMPDKITRKEKQGFGAKETDPAVIHVRADSPFEFDEDKSPVIICDWEGNYKKGEFSLLPTWIYKKAPLSLKKVKEMIYTYSFEYLNFWKDNFQKSTVHFDGLDSDWGEITYVSEIKQTGQSK